MCPPFPNRANDKPGSVATVPFPPDLSKYQVVLEATTISFQSWPEEFNCRNWIDALKNNRIESA